MPNQVRLNQDYPNITESEKLYERAQGLMPAFAQTLAKGPTQYVDGVAPKYLRRAKGARVGRDGNEYLDYNMAIGPISLGYGYEVVDDAIRRQLEDGIVFPLIHPWKSKSPNSFAKSSPMPSVRFAKGRAEVTSAAVRPARAYGPRQGPLLWLSRLARLVHRHHRPRYGRAPGRERPRVYLQL